ncbi:Similar to ppm-2: Probable protein phosphatase 2C T23F11.1 (Caenorhabditis elegans) [Cotesia congregata]|uniref:protein-serine/threonine phosphatase n=1 Tax=Cotesia congregata TaxID=51543 RepID=A0A8J2EMV7_COTCN|nr:Similar to ppm-2: Probable protein phosphatase 2C T23F11.1 (Caenorhabditis elegans) [Cotesia congregata]
MGQTLSEPVTTKQSACCRDENYLVGSSSMQGWRVKMEDCHVHILSLPEDPGTAFFAVYDGHGGKIVEAMEQGFLQLDEAMQADTVLRAERAGTTVIAILIKDNVLYSANAGDSRAIASVNGYLVELSRDHKPTLEDERKRIEAAGGWVEFNRVNGHLALSRALGDFKFKWNNTKTAEEQIVTAFPEVQKFEINKDWEFIVLACDGIWDVMTSHEVLDFIRNYIATQYNVNEDSHPRSRDSSIEDYSEDSDKGGKKNLEKATVDPELICEELLNHCLAPDALMGTGCDNMTAIVVCLLHGKPVSDLILRCQRKSHDTENLLHINR